jgi:regulator of RNase E activity RraA
VADARDPAADLRRIAFPVFSCGSYLCGPRRLDPRPADALEMAQVGELSVTREHVVFADDDGVLFLKASEANAVLDAAMEIFTRERAQAERLSRGITLARQFRLDDYIAARDRDPGLTFRVHLRDLTAEIEE